MRSSETPVRAKFAEFIFHALASGAGGFERLTSAVQRRQDRFPDISGDCKTPANRYIFSSRHFSKFQAIYSGCCTVAAQTFLVCVLA
jgi:hypothetical protein